MTEQLRNELEQLLAETDQFVANADNANTSEEAKTWIRRFHETQRETRLNNAKDFITQKEDDLIANLANGTDVNPEHIDPTITPVITQHDKDLWKYASLTWSVPVSEGYGRRTKFLVRDRQNGKLIAIFALGDPVIALGPRDDTIGWTKEQRHNRLYNVFDAFVLGAIDPYRQLLAGKLVALCALANETRTFLTNKYSGTTTVLREEQKPHTRTHHHQFSTRKIIHLQQTHLLRTQSLPTHRLHPRLRPLPHPRRHLPTTRTPHQSRRQQR